MHNISKVQKSNRCKDQKGSTAAARRITPCALWFQTKPPWRTEAALGALTGSWRSSPLRCLRCSGRGGCAEPAAAAAAAPGTAGRRRREPRPGGSGHSRPAAPGGPGPRAGDERGPAARSPSGSSDPGAQPVLAAGGRAEQQQWRRSRRQRGRGGSGRPGPAAAGWDRSDPAAPSLPPPRRARPAPPHPRTPRLSPFSSGPGWVSAPTLVLLSPGSSCSWFGVGGGGACLHLSGLGSAAAEGWVWSGRARTTLRGRREARDAEDGAGSAPHRDPGLAAVSARRLSLIIVRLGRRRSRGVAASARTAPGSRRGLAGRCCPPGSPRGGPAADGSGASASLRQWRAPSGSGDSPIRLQ